MSSRRSITAAATIKSARFTEKKIRRLLSISNLSLSNKGNKTRPKKTERRMDMKEYKLWKFGLMVALALTLALAGCGGGGDAPNPDTDGDGIPNGVDALPNNPALFVDNVTVQLAGLTPAGGGFSSATAVNNAGKVVEEG